MTIFDMLEQSWQLTLLGMGIVFGFLIIMVIAITLAGKVIRAAGLDKDVQPAVSTAVKQAGDPGVTAAISAAVNEYRKNN